MPTADQGVSVLSETGWTSTVGYSTGTITGPFLRYWREPVTTEEDAASDVEHMLDTMQQTCAELRAENDRLKHQVNMLSKAGPVQSELEIFLKKCQEQIQTELADKIEEHWYGRKSTDTNLWGYRGQPGAPTLQGVLGRPGGIIRPY